MTSVELEVDEQSYVGSKFMAHVAREIRRALIAEKSSRKITQQAVADKIGTSRAVINREVSGLENLTARRMAELLWALGWEPHFEAHKIPDGQNHFLKPKQESWDQAKEPKKPYQTITRSGSSNSAEAEVVAA